MNNHRNCKLQFLNYGKWQDIPSSDWAIAAITHDGVILKYITRTILFNPDSLWITGNYRLSFTVK
jgi:hypothetical protein